VNNILDITAIGTWRSIDNRTDPSPSVSIPWTRLEKALQEQTMMLIGPICKLRRKEGAANLVPGSSHRIVHPGRRRNGATSGSP
jgi:hypothetical protein